MNKEAIIRKIEGVLQSFDMIAFNSDLSDGECEVIEGPLEEVLVMLKDEGMEERVCPYCKGYVEPIEPGSVIGLNSKMEMGTDNAFAHEWRCCQCGWYWTDKTVQQATWEYYNE